MAHYKVLPKRTPRAPPKMRFTNRKLVALWEQ